MVVLVVAVHYRLYLKHLSMFTNHPNVCHTEYDREDKKLTGVTGIVML